jgi:endonuclease/exonuclease/phosphatase family metal-dependent hydrolase
MDFVFGAGNYKASAVLSRFAILDSVNHGPLQKDLTKSLLEATVVDGGGRAWSVGVLHLHAQALEADEAIREREIDVVLKIFEPHREAGRGHVLMGDFNANSPVQEIDPALCKRSTREAWEKNGGGIPRRAIGRVIDAGYMDTFHAVDPRLAATTGTFSTEFPGQRVDYIFSFGIERAGLKSARIIYEGDSQEASDHFPVAAEFA